MTLQELTRHKRTSKEFTKRYRNLEDSQGQDLTGPNRILEYLRGPHRMLEDLTGPHRNLGDVTGPHRNLEDLTGSCRTSQVLRGHYWISQELRGRYGISQEQDLTGPHRILENVTGPHRILEDTTGPLQEGKAPAQLACPGLSGRTGTSLGISSGTGNRRFTGRKKNTRSASLSWIRENWSQSMN